MAKVLVRLSIPERLRDGMMLKVGYPNTFDVPHTKKGIEFLEFWKNASKEVRDDLMKRAYDEEASIVDIKPKDDDEDDSADVLPDPEDEDQDEDDEEDD
jgi:hypothetical protein